MALEEIRGERIKKLKDLGGAEIDVFPATVSKKREEIAAVLNKYFKKPKSTSRPGTKNKEIVVVGRLFAKREHGGSCFGDLKDASGKIQVFFK